MCVCVCVCVKPEAYTDVCVHYVALVTLFLEGMHPHTLSPGVFRGVYVRVCKNI